LTLLRLKPLLQTTLALVGAASAAKGAARSRVVPKVALFLLCNSAKVLPRGTFGAFVSGYFRNPASVCGFGDHSASYWPNGLQAAPFTGRQIYLTNAFSTWPAYCPMESADCSDA
jgi:hypothetical protein